MAPRLPALLCPWLALPLALLLGAVPPAFGNDKQQTQTQLQQLKSEMGKLQKMLQEFRSERARLEKNLRASEVEIGETERRIRDIQQQLQQQERELDDLRERRDALQESRTDQQQQIARQVRGAYELGREDKLKTLLNQEDPARVSRALTYYDYFNRARAAQIDAYVDLIAELDTLEPAIEEKAGSLRVARAELDAEQKKLLSARSERQAALAKLAGTIKSKDSELKQMAQDRSSLEQLLRKLEAASRAAAAKAAAKTPAATKPGQTAGPVVRSGDPVSGNFAALRGKLPWPVTGRPDNRFGAKRGSSDLKWQGINIAAPEGSTVRAIHGGKVVFADWLRGSGLLIIVDHGSGYLSLYAHNQSLLRNVGDRVAGGDAIATVGSSGGQDQAALYFEIRQRGVPTDPAQWCRRA
jgi:septal ring factor EnvC (AmiA/AmiB activator)